MNFDCYVIATPVEKELFNLLIQLQKDVDYLKSVARRLEKELPEDDNEQK